MIRPAASILFAAWIFIGFLQQRYDAAIERYRACIAEFRGSDMSNERRCNFQEQVLIYRPRCKLISYSSMTGLVLAIVLLLALISGELSIVSPAIDGLKYVGAVAAMLGFVLIIVAAVLVIVESTITHRQIASELMDTPELARSVGQEPGAIRDENRGSLGGPHRLPTGQHGWS